MPQTLRHAVGRLGTGLPSQQLYRALSTSIASPAPEPSGISRRASGIASWKQGTCRSDATPGTQLARQVSQMLLHTTQPRSIRPPQRRAPPPEEREGTQGTDIGSFDVLADAPEPETSVSTCLADGFRLTSGIMVRNSGLLLVDGEAFSWRPWGDARNPKLANSKGQWELPDPEQALGLLGLVWPRPDLLLLGLGAEMRPLSPATRSFISGLGIRVEVLDTRNAAAQYNLLATERGTKDIAAALVPAGFGRTI